MLKEISPDELIVHAHNLNGRQFLLVLDSIGALPIFATVLFRLDRNFILGGKLTKVGTFRPGG